MTDEEFIKNYKNTVISIAKSFQELPDDLSRIELIKSLTGVMVKRPVKSLTKDWLIEAERALDASVKAWNFNDSSLEPGWSRPIIEENTSIGKSILVFKSINTEGSEPDFNLNNHPTEDWDDG